MNLETFVWKIPSLTAITYARTLRRISFFYSNGHANSSVRDSSLLGTVVLRYLEGLYRASEKPLALSEATAVIDSDSEALWISFYPSVRFFKYQPRLTRDQVNGGYTGHQLPESILSLEAYLGTVFFGGLFAPLRSFATVAPADPATQGHRRS